MSKPLDKELNKTLRAVKKIKAKRVDDLEDYFHDSIVRVLFHGKPLEEWLGYVYQSVSKRVACGQEGRTFLSLDEALLPHDKSPNIDLVLDVEKAMLVLTPMQYDYIYDYFYEGFTLEEIAMLHDTTNQAVSQAIQRGLQQMKKVLKGS